MTSRVQLKALRLTHNYIGVFFAPTILFFCDQWGPPDVWSRIQPRKFFHSPAILIHLSQLHKKGTLYVPVRKTAPHVGAESDTAKPDAPKSDLSKAPAPPPVYPAANPLPMKVFFGATALALVISTFTGLLMFWNLHDERSCSQQFFTRALFVL